MIVTVYLSLYSVDEVELEALFEQFKALATSKNGIDKETFERCLGPLGVETNLITDRIFKFFDQGVILAYDILRLYCSFLMQMAMVLSISRNSCAVYPYCARVLPRKRSSVHALIYAP